MPKESSGKRPARFWFFLKKKNGCRARIRTMNNAEKGRW
jgi:hypothetical protein